MTTIDGIPVVESASAKDFYGGLMRTGVTLGMAWAMLQSGKAQSEDADAIERAICDIWFLDNVDRSNYPGVIAAGDITWPTIKDLLVGAVGAAAFDDVPGPMQ